MSEIEGRREHYCDDDIFRDMKQIIDVLVGLVGSYRLLVGAANELNTIALAHRHEVEEALELVNKMADIIEELENEIKKLMRIYIREVNAKVKITMLSAGREENDGESEEN